MDDWIGISAGIFTIALFPVAIVYFLLALRHAWPMFEHMRGDWWVSLLSPFSLVMPQFFDEVGKAHRIRFLRHAAAGIALLLVLKEAPSVA
ncbi:MAG: hypothetical protein ACXW20_12380 [Burkholderiales bacterium]